MSFVLRRVVAGLVAANVVVGAAAVMATTPHAPLALRTARGTEAPGSTTTVPASATTEAPTTTEAAPSTDPASLEPMLVGPTGPQLAPTAPTTPDPTGSADPQADGDPSNPAPPHCDINTWRPTVQWTAPPPAGVHTYCNPLPSMSIWDSTIDSSGRLWITDPNHSEIDIVHPDGSLSRFPAPDQVQGLAPALDGGVWSAGYNGLYHFAPDGAVAFTAIPGVTGQVATSVAATRDGSVWLSGAGTLWRVRPSGEINAVISDIAAGEATVGGDGNVWVAEGYADHSALARVTLDGTVTEPLPNMEAARLTTGHDGSLLFAFGDPGLFSIARYTMDGHLHTWPLDTDAAPNTITDASDGTIFWASQFYVGVIRDTAKRMDWGYITELRRAPDGTIWYFDNDAGTHGWFTSALL